MKTIQNKIWNSLDEECKEFIKNNYIHFHAKRMYESIETLDHIFNYENLNDIISEDIKEGDKVEILYGPDKGRVGNIENINTYSVSIKFPEGDYSCLESYYFKVIKDKKYE